MSLFLYLLRKFTKCAFERSLQLLLLFSTSKVVVFHFGKKKKS